MKQPIFLAGSLALLTSFSYGATAIWGGYFTVDGTKYKSSGIYGGTEPTFDGHNFGTLTEGLDSLILSQAETLTSQSDGHSTFAHAFAYNVRLSGDAESNNPADFDFLNLGDGADLGSGNEKGEITGQTIDLMNGLAPGNYSIDVVHKVGAWEGGSNFERIANVNSVNPGDTAWSSVNAFTGTFTVTAVPEPSSAVLAGLGALAFGVRRRR